MDVLFGLAFTIFKTPCIMTGSKKNDPFKGLFIVSKIDPSVSSISLANFVPTLTKKLLNPLATAVFSLYILLSKLNSDSGTADSKFLLIITFNVPHVFLILDLFWDKSSS